MENLIFNPREVLSVYRVGQREGFVAGVTASIVAYYMFKAYTPALRIRVKNQDEGTIGDPKK